MHECKALCYPVSSPREHLWHQTLPTSMRSNEQNQPRPSIPTCQLALTEDPASPRKMPMPAAALMSATTPHLNKSHVLERCTGNVCVCVPQFPHLPSLPSLIFLIPSVQLLVLAGRGTPGIHLAHWTLPASASSMQPNLSNPSPKFGRILPRALT